MRPDMENFDIIILGAGAAGMFCAGSLIARDPDRNLRILVLDHAKSPGEKIRISGGGRCNFTNLATSYDRFLSQNKRFCASALSGYRPDSFVGLVNAAGIAWHEKTAGQLFCDGSSRQVVDLLLNRMRGAELRLGVGVHGLSQQDGRFVVSTTAGMVSATVAIVATGGRSIPKMGATGIGYDIAASFGLRLIEPRAGLVPLTFATQDLNLCKPLAGVSVDAEVRHGAMAFRDALLFTHRGLSGPAILQISSYWTPGDEIRIDLAPGQLMSALLKDARGKAGRSLVATVLAQHLPARLAAQIASDCGLDQSRLADQNNETVERLAGRINDWRLKPVGSEGWRTAEVTVGGVDTRDLNAKTMCARAVPGLYFIGEVVDVTGWLGGYNFQWAWASAEAAAHDIADMMLKD